MHATLVIPARFRGPPASANGGYTAGSLAAWIDGEAEVTLRRPPPLERPLDVQIGPGDVKLLDDGELVAEGGPAVVDLEPPEPVTVDDAAAASERSHFRRAPGEHPFPSCFVCGPDRTPGDGLRLLPGPVSGREVVAVPWTPASEFDDGHGNVRGEIVWSALDCPSSFAMYLEEDPLEGPFVLGRLAARIDAPVATGAPHIVLGWRVGLDARKLFAGSALYDARGTPLAVARATWIHV
jgi:hypothetical protein